MQLHTGICVNITMKTGQLQERCLENTSLGNISVLKSCAVMQYMTSCQAEDSCCVCTHANEIQSKDWKKAEIEVTGLEECSRWVFHRGQGGWGACEGSGVGGGKVGGVEGRYSTSKRKEHRIPAMVRALVAVTPDSLKPACLATATSLCAQLIARHSAAKMNGSNLKMSLEPVSIVIQTLVCSVVHAMMSYICARQCCKHS